MGETCGSMTNGQGSEAESLPPQWYKNILYTRYSFVVTMGHPGYIPGFLVGMDHAADVTDAAIHSVCTI